MNCKGCMWLDYSKNKPKDGSGYCCKVERSSQRNLFRTTPTGERRSAKVRYPDSKACEFYEAGEYPEGYYKK